MKKYEVEQKYRVARPAAFRKKIRALRAKKISSGHEENEIFDLRPLGVKAGILRLRRKGPGKGLLTFKGPQLGGRFKKRLELETAVDPQSMRAILRLLHFKPAYRYSKTREEYRKGNVLITLDYLKGHGWFAEIEASPREIHSTERKLGLSVQDREPRTYLEILQIGTVSKSARFAVS